MSKNRNPQNIPQPSTSALSALHQKWTDAELEAIFSTDMAFAARLSALERFVKDLAVQSLGDTPETVTSHLINRRRWRSQRFWLPARRFIGRIPAAGCNRRNNNAGRQKIGFSCRLLASHGVSSFPWLRAKLAAAGICEMACSFNQRLDTYFIQCLEEMWEFHKAGNN